MRHVVIMSITSTIGLVALSAADLVDMVFIALLGSPSLSKRKVVLFAAACWSLLCLTACTLVAVVKYKPVYFCLLSMFKQAKFLVQPFFARFFFAQSVQCSGNLGLPLKQQIA